MGESVHDRDAHTHALARFKKQKVLRDTELHAHEHTHTSSIRGNVGQISGWQMEIDDGDTTRSRGILFASTIIICFPVDGEWGWISLGIATIFRHTKV